MRRDGCLARHQTDRLDAENNSPETPIVHYPDVQRISLEPLGDLNELAVRWQALERLVGCGFFTSWTFLGCQVADRFGKAKLLCVTQDGHDVALALLGRRRGRRWLNQTGEPAKDAVFIEHNGLLASGDTPAAAAALRTACGAAGLVLSGVNDATLLAARSAGWVHLSQSRWAPRVDLQALAQPYLDTLSSNTRAQIRRSMRLFGPDLRLTRASTPDAARDYFHDMVALHQEAWRRRGKAGAFADPETRTFHLALIARAWPKEEADLLRVTAGGRHVGTLYMLMRNGVVHSYQSGFAEAASPQEKPGLVCHALAIARYAANGAKCYDLLGGADRYKLSLARDGEMLHWGTLDRAWSASGVSKKVSSFLKKRTKKLLFPRARVG